MQPRWIASSTHQVTRGSPRQGAGAQGVAGSAQLDPRAGAAEDRVAAEQRGILLRIFKAAAVTLGEDFLRALVRHLALSVSRER